MRRIRRTTAAILTTVALATVLVLSGCGSDPYDEMADIISGQAQITENYIEGLEKAENSEDVVAVINEFSEGMKTLIPKIKSYQEKYPEIWNENTDVPENVQAQQARLETASGKIQSATMKLVSYMMDPDVQEAMTNMGEEMSQLQ